MEVFLNNGRQISSTPLRTWNSIELAAVGMVIEQILIPKVGAQLTIPVEDLEGNKGIVYIKASEIWMIHVSEEDTFLINQAMELASQSGENQNVPTNGHAFEEDSDEGSTENLTPH